MIPACGAIIGSGSVLASAPHPGQAALILLDALQPVGTCAIYVDSSDLLAMLGSVASVEPLATVQMLGLDALSLVGQVVVPHGRVRWGDKVLAVRSAADPETVYMDVFYGELRVLSLPVDEQGTMLELAPARGVDVGNGRGKSVQMPYPPGSVGLIVDARGRPLVPLGNAPNQRERVSNWLDQMTGERGV